MRFNKHELITLAQQQNSTKFELEGILSLQEKQDGSFGFFRKTEGENSKTI